VGAALQQRLRASSFWLFFR